MIKSRSFVAILLLIGVLSWASSIAQTSDITLKGTVVDSAGKVPLEWLTIGLMNAKDSVSQTTLSNVDGKFSFSRVSNGNYMLRFQGVGYKSRKIAVNIDGSTTIHDMGTLFITSQIQNLKTVNINAHKPIIKQGAGRITYDLNADPQSKSSSVLEMMRKVPFLSVDANENIRLNGSASYRVFINGKPSGLLERPTRKKC